MKKANHIPYIFHSITQMNKALGLPEPPHPLISLNNHKEMQGDVSEIAKGMIMDFYKISYKKHMSGKIRYGSHYYDFNNGGMSFISPGQLIAEDESNAECDGLTLLIHPDFFNGYALSANIRNYAFFSYTINEALQLSEKEKGTVLELLEKIGEELSQRLDHFSQDVIISQIELLLNYSNRFYNRQFLTRKVANNDVMSKMESLLHQYFDGERGLTRGLPTVQYLASELSVSPGYLSDMLRAHTGMNAQQHIHQKLIEKAKEYLISGRLTVAEVAYQLGFERPQSFNKLFKSKTNQSPLQYRTQNN